MNNEKYGQVTHRTKIGADSLAENIPNAQKFWKGLIGRP